MKTDERIDDLVIMLGDTMCMADSMFAQLYHMLSNHITIDPQEEKAWRENVKAWNYATSKIMASYQSICAERLENGTGDRK